MKIRLVGAELLLADGQT